MQEDVALMSQRVEQTVGQNKGLLAQRKALQLELRVQQEMGQQHAQRALASRRLGKHEAEARALGEAEATELAEKEVTMTGILVSMSVAMSWSGFVALVHNPSHRELQGSFAVSLRPPKALLHVVRAERHLVGLEEHRA